MSAKTEARDPTPTAGLPGRSRLVMGALALLVLVLAGASLAIASRLVQARRDAAMQAVARDLQGEFRRHIQFARLYADRLAADALLRESLGGVEQGGAEVGAEARGVLQDRLALAGLSSQMILVIHDPRGRPLVYHDGRGERPANGFFASGEASAGLSGGQVATPLTRDSLRLGPSALPAWRAIDGDYCLMQTAPVTAARETVGLVSVMVCNLLQRLHVASPSASPVSLDWWPALPRATVGARAPDLPAARLVEAADLLAEGETASHAFRIDGRLALALRLPGDVAGPEYLILSMASDSPQLSLPELTGATLLAALLGALLALPLCLWRVELAVARPLEKLREGVLALRRRDYPAVHRLADEETPDDNPAQAELWRLGELASQLVVRERELKLWYSVFARTREAVFICNPDGIVEYANPALLAVGGWTEEAVLGRLPSFLLAGLHDDGFYVAFWQSLSLSGQWQGEVWDRRGDGSTYPMWLSMSAVNDESGEVAHYVGMFRDISENKAHEAQIQYLVHFDALTHLPNRGLLRDRLAVALAHAQRETGLVALLFIDLDRFKQINDTLGHAVGDALLKEVAERLKRAVRAADTVCRLGADEFIVLLDRLRSVHDAELVAEHIIAVLAPAAEVLGHDLSITPSIGIALYPEHASDPDELIRKADVAMYHAKSLGRNKYQVFDSAMTDQAVESLSLEQHLRLAVDRDEFVLFFQPQIEIARRRLVGVEALVRWNSPDLGLVSPAKFIPLAEECGLIQQIGDWVMREACRQRAEWTRAGVAAFPVAVNVSALQFRQADFARRVREAMGLYGVPAAALELELTESIVMQEDEAAARTLEALQALGVGLAIDDFGTGYSSLSYLKRLPIRKLKIDGSFVRGVEAMGPDRAIVEAIVSMGRALGMDLVAEGVENAATLRAIDALGCGMAQGYFYCPPLPAGEFAAWWEEFALAGQPL